MQSCRNSSVYPKLPGRKRCGLECSPTARPPMSCRRWGPSFITAKTLPSTSCCAGAPAAARMAQALLRVTSLPVLSGTGGDFFSPLTPRLRFCFSVSVAAFAATDLETPNYRSHSRRDYVAGEAARSDKASRRLPPPASPQGSYLLHWGSKALLRAPRPRLLELCKHELRAPRPYPQQSFKRSPSRLEKSLLMLVLRSDRHQNASIRRTRYPTRVYVIETSNCSSVLAAL